MTNYLELFRMYTGMLQPELRNEKEIKSSSDSEYLMQN